MISSTSNQTIKDLMKLKQKKYRDEYYLVEGEHLVEEAIKSHQAELIITTKEINTPIKTIIVSDEVMAKLAFTKSPQPIMAKCKINHDNQIIKGKRYLILDDLQDPGNIGTLIRTALAFNYDQVILSNNCVDLYNDKLLRSMQGANFHISCIYQDLTKAISQLKGNGVTVIASALENGTEITNLETSANMAICVGNEGNGMNKEIISCCDKIAYIPINTIESLNVAVAGSIMMYHFR